MGYGTRTKGCKHSDHLKSTTGLSPAVRKASNLVSRPELILYLIKIWKAISESEPEVDAVVVSAPVEGYESSDFLVLGLPSPLYSRSDQGDVTDLHPPYFDICSSPIAFPRRAVAEPGALLTLEVLHPGV